MNYRNIIIALGFLVIVLPFLGVPRSWKETAFVFVGLAVIALAYFSSRAPKPVV